MKKVFAGLISIFMALSLMLPTVSIYAEDNETGGATSTSSGTNENGSSTGFSNDSTANLTLTNAVAGDKFIAYKLIDIKYDETTNTLSYGWNEEFKDCMAKLWDGNENTSTSISVEDYRNLTADSRRQILAQLHNHIVKENNKTIIDTVTADEDGIATFKNLAMGGYLIMATETTDVYQYIFKSVEPVIVDGNYSLDAVSFSVKAKHNSIMLEKKVNEQDDISAMTNQKLTYTVTADVPLYGQNALEKMFSITDTPEESITINVNSITVYAQKPGGEWENFTDNEKNKDDKYYTLTTTYGNNDGIIENYTVKVENTDDNKQFDNWYSYTVQDSGNGTFTNVYTAQYTKIKIEYTAILNEKAQLAAEKNNSVDSNLNEATITFYPYPYPNVNNVDEDGNPITELKTSTASDKAEVYTYGIEIFKYGNSNTDNPLSNAKFKLYLDEEATNLVTGYYYSTNNKNWTLLNSDTDIATKNGYLYIKGLAEGTYYLKETQAPENYTGLTNPVQVTIKTKNNSYKLDATTASADAAKEAKEGYVLVEINNNSGFTLPATGGTGVIILKILGVIAMAVAVVVVAVVLTRPKKKTDK